MDEVDTQPEPDLQLSINSALWFNDQDRVSVEISLADVHVGMAVAVLRDLADHIAIGERPSDDEGVQTIRLHPRQKDATDDDIV